MADILWPIAKNSEGDYVPIREALRGTEYFCPECNSKMIARLGTIRQHHFGHYSNNSECCGESGYHFLAKHILAYWFQTQHKIVIKAQCHTCRKKYNVVGNVSDVIVERGETDYRPDVQVIFESGAVINCEVIYKNTLSVDKIKKYKELQTPLLIWKIDKDVQAFMGFELVSWSSFDLFYGRYESVLYANMPVPRHTCLKVEAIKLVEHGCAIHTEWCPIHQRDYHGKSYANYIDDCSCCKFCMGSIDHWFTDRGGWPGGIWCIGRQKKEVVEKKEGGALLADLTTASYVG